jgi:hypothetical protein
MIHLNVFSSYSTRRHVLSDAGALDYEKYFQCSNVINNEEVHVEDK